MKDGYYDELQVLMDNLVEIENRSFVTMMDERINKKEGLRNPKDWQSGQN